MKKLLSLFTAVIFLCSTSTIAFAANDSQEAIVQNKIKFQQMNKNILETNSQITELNTQISKLNNEIGNNNKDIAEINKAIKVEKKHMQQVSKEIASSQELANKRLRAMYINGYSENIIEFLLTSENFSDFISKYEAAKNIVSYDKDVLSSLAEKRRSLDESIEELNIKNKRLEELKQSNIDRLNGINEDKQKLEALVERFSLEKSSAADLIKENEENLIAHAISVIKSDSSNSSTVRSAIQTLKSLVSQISTDSVKAKAKEYIISGNKKLAELTAKEAEVPNRGSNSSAVFKASYTMSATAYTGGGYTAMGLKTVRDPYGLSTIAVDPSVIPLGTKVYIPGYGYAIASDTGGAINGNIIDLYMDSYEECIQWGRRSVTLQIVAYPGEW